MSRTTIRKLLRHNNVFKILLVLKLKKNGFDFCKMISETINNKSNLFIRLTYVFGISVKFRLNLLPIVMTVAIGHQEYFEKYISSIPKN